MRPLRARWLAVPLLLAIAVGACSPSDEEAGLTLFTAASLRSVADDFAEAWLAEHPGVPLTVASEASNVLAAQIAEGAPADVFLSADTRRPLELADSGLTAAPPVPFARNRVTLVAPTGEDRVQSAADLAAPGIRIVSTGPGTPIAGYAAEAVGALAATTPEPAVFAAAVGANVVTQEDNVRAALAKIQLGEGDAAFVYATDAFAATGVREVELPTTARVAADYAAVQVSDRADAAAFIDWLAGPAAARILESHGFERAP